jgi:hypothetical protein
MSVLSFSDLQKELKAEEFKNPKITFGFNSFTLTSRVFFNDIFGLCFFWTISISLCLHSSGLFFGILFLIVSCYFFYWQFIGLNICIIDFTAKKISIRNRIFLLNILRKYFGPKTEFYFSDIKEISFKDGVLLDRLSGYKTRSLLIIETYSDPAIVTSQFKKEEDANKIAGILKKFIMDNKKL